jgi:hypothetical protein
MRDVPICLSFREMAGHGGPVNQHHGNVPQHLVQQPMLYSAV